MNRKDRDRGAEMRLTERTRKLIPETRRGDRKERSVMRREDDVGGQAMRPNNNKRIRMV